MKLFKISAGKVWIKGRSKKSLPSYWLCEKHFDCNDLIQNAAGRTRSRAGANPKYGESEDQQQMIRDAQKNRGDRSMGNGTGIQRQGLLQTILEQPDGEVSSLDPQLPVSGNKDSSETEEATDVPGRQEQITDEQEYQIHLRNLRLIIKKSKSHGALHRLNWKFVGRKSR
ncbi:hypothetical protein QAD02_020476 [Eretmocerus hayati]|uniref:Uncharacterized protein n=1 Tax=Eretmocerus hayati TaxID=131215 RepID=A0ACC2PML5_9HYME|nr:hypothetical protein QAD02_020476 [Eretmocerus hayati]